MSSSEKSRSISKIVLNIQYQVKVRTVSDEISEVTSKVSWSEFDSHLIL